MTSRVNIDAHAGWDIQVVVSRGEPASNKSVEVHYVRAGTSQDFYIHSGQRILAIEEMPDRAVQPAPA